MDFDMIADDDAMADMSREYEKVLRRSDLMKGVDVPHHQASDKSMIHSPRCYGVKCGTGDLKERKLFEKIYCLEMDMISQLKHLHMIAPLDVREQISNVIKLKKRCGAKLLRCYYNSGDEIIQYLPVISHDRNYCRLLKHIISDHEKLLVMLTRSHRYCVYIKRVFSIELTAGYILNSMAIYCR